MTGGGSGAEGFERVFDLVGGHGRFQWRLLAIVSLQLIIVTFHHISYAFLGSVPDHWCHIPALAESNWTLDQIKMISIPQESRDPEDPDKPVFSKCDFYNLDYTGLVQSSSSFQDAYEKVDWGSVTQGHCSKWSYDDSIYKSTIVTDFDLVCGKRWMVATIQSTYMGGGIIGTLALGSISDRFLGRRNTVLLSLSVVIVGGIVAAFSVSYWMFLSIRFIMGIGVAGSLQNGFVLVTEHADKDYRALAAMLEQLPFAIGYMILPGLAYFLRSWNHLELSFGLISLGLIVYWWILPESPRWLATKGYTDKALEALYKMAAVNRLPKPCKEELEAILKDCQNETKAKPVSPIETPQSADASDLARIVLKYLKAFVHNFKNLMKTAEIRRRSLAYWTIFTAVAMCYYGIVFSGNISSDPYLVVFLGGLMEVPAYTVTVPFLGKLGRRPTTAATFFLTGGLMLGLSQTPTSYEAIRITLGMLAKLFVATGFAIIYLLGAELYPTELRTTGLAVGVFAGRLGAVTAPYIVDLLVIMSTYFGLEDAYKDLPAIIFGVVAIGGGLVSLLLPETATLEMSDKIAQIERKVDSEDKLEEKKRKSLKTVLTNGEIP